MRRRSIILCAIVIVIPLLFISCSEQTSSSAKPELSPPGQLPLVQEPVTLTAFVPSIGFIEDFSTNALYLWIEEQTNVKIEWIESSKVDAKNKLSVLLASGEYPDIIFGASGSGLANQDIYRYGRQGIFIPLNNLIESHSYWLKDLFIAEPQYKDIITSPDGNIYGLPAVITDDYHMTMRQKFWINKRWLNTLGLEIPRTTDEFYVVMRAFKEQDANGNGNRSDEIPMTGAKRNLENMALWIMSAFVPAGGPDDSGDAFLSNYEFVIDNTVVFSANMDDYREGLRFLHKMYSEGLFDISALTQDRSQIKPLIEGTVNRIGAFASHHPSNVATLTDDMNEPIHDYVVLPPLTGPKGFSSTPWLIDAVIRPGEYVITDRCKHPELAFRYADQFYRLESMLHDKGIEGVHWTKVHPSEKLVALNGEMAKYKYLKPLSAEDNAQINMGPGWTRNLKNEFARSKGFSYEELLFNATKIYEPFKIKRFPYSTASISDESFSEFIDLRRIIHTYVGEATNRFIIGELDIEYDWNDYVQELEQMGLSRYLEILRNSL